MKNLIEDILSTVNFKSAVYFKHGFCSPWGMDVSQSPYSQFHLVTNGNCQLKFKQKFVELEKGDIIIFSNGAPHQIMDKNNPVCKPGNRVVEEIQNEINPFVGERVSTHLICGHFELDREISHPIFNDLPELIIIKSSEYGRYELICTIFELIVDELSQKRIGYEIISLKFAEILYISIIRHYYLNQSEDTSNFFKDEAIFKAINIIHREIKSPLPIEKLAKSAGLSRTVFIGRFKNAIGNTPLRYIKNWRMVKAKRLLLETDLPLINISEQVGYASEASFNRAFNQTYNISPGKFRKTNN